jgi:hypothetical protein
MPLIFRHFGARIFTHLPLNTMFVFSDHVAGNNFHCPFANEQKPVEKELTVAIFNRYHSVDVE